MRDIYYLPWEHKIREDGLLLEGDDEMGQNAVKYLARRISNETSYTEHQAAEALFRLVGYMCQNGKLSS